LETAVFIRNQAHGVSEGSAGQFIRHQRVPLFAVDFSPSAFFSQGAASMQEISKPYRK